MNSKITIPVLLVAFNRPDTTKIVFSKIREAKPKKLYVAIDGPRKHKLNDNVLVDDVKSIVNNVDWDCKTYYHYNEGNKGAETTVSSAISWVLESEEYVIILEDDIVAPISFFQFAQEMLIKYKDEERIGTVTSNNFTPMKLPNNVDYLFAKYGHSWGWATWRRTWQDFDLKAEIKKEHLELSFLKKITNTKTEAKYYQRLFKKMKANGVGNNTWDFMALYQHRIKNQLSIIPRVNLSSNIGIYGLHARGKGKLHNLPFDETFIAKNHPEKVECLDSYDLYHFKKNIRNPIYLKIIRRIKRICKLNND